MEKSASKQNEISSTLDSQSFSLDKNRSKAVSLSKLPREYNQNYISKPARPLKFMNNSFTNRPIKVLESNCEIVFEEEFEETEEGHKKFNKFIPILDKREEMMFRNNRGIMFSDNSDRPKSTEITLPKVIESKDEYSYFYDKRKYKFANYLAFLDKTEKFNLMKPKTISETKEDQLFDSQNAIEEVNQNEEDIGANDNDCCENRSNSIKSGSISRISNNSFIKKRIIDECVIFDREKEMSEIVF